VVAGTARTFVSGLALLLGSAWLLPAVHLKPPAADARARTRVARPRRR
jgi:hypothetical protein